MKKILIGVAALAVLAFVVVMAVNATGTKAADNKAKTECSKDDSKCATEKSCCQDKEKHANCDPANCDNPNCTHSKEKCGEHKEKTDCKSAEKKSDCAKKCDGHKG